MKRMIVALISMTSTGLAQDLPQEPASDAVSRLDRRLGEVDSHVAELRTILQRQAAGEDVSGLRWLQVTDVDRTRADAVGPTVVSAAQEQSDALREELARLETALVVAREQAEARALGDTLPRPEELARLARRARGEDQTPSTPGPARLATGREAALPVGVSRGPAAARGGAMIHGTVDRARVGAVLLEAGIDLFDSARDLETEGRVEAAQAQRAHARERLEAARAELEPLARSADAPLAIVFTLARTEEKLGRLAVADALYASIIERDRLPVRVDHDAELGPFGRSARTARAVMNWVRDTSDWRPRRDVDKIRWDAR